MPSAGRAPAGHSNIILRMISKETEKVQFLEPLDPNKGDRKGAVELWLGDVENMMQKSLVKVNVRDIYKMNCGDSDLTNPICIQFKHTPVENLLI